MVDTPRPGPLAKFQDSIGVVTTEKMKPTGRQTSQSKPFERNPGALTDSGLDVETKIFSASGRGRTFFLTSLFIELIETFRA